VEKIKTYESWNGEFWRNARHLTFVDGSGCCGIKWASVLKLVDKVVLPKYLSKPIWSFLLPSAASVMQMQRSVVDSSQAGRPCRVWILVDPVDVVVSPEMRVGKNLVIGRFCDGRLGAFLPIVANDSARGAAAGPSGAVVKERGAGDWDVRFVSVPELPVQVGWFGVACDYWDWKVDGRGREEISVPVQLYGAWCGPKSGGVACAVQGAKAAARGAGEFLGQLASCPRRDGLGLQIMDMGGAGIYEGQSKARVYG
jgi:hypothetical protein